MTQVDAISWPSIYTDLIGGRDLDRDTVEWAMGQIMDGAATPAQIAGFLIGLRAKGESVAEMHGLAEVMLSRAHRIEVEGPSLDIVGTGGDRAHTVNISTMSSIVAAAAGIRIVKHGNRAASSSSGSADVLEALGIDLSLPPERVVEIVHEAGITFCFAQTFHPSFRHTAVPRRELGVGSAFNFLGPLTNPAQPTYAAIGCADAAMAPLLAGVFASRGKDAAVFRGDDGLDEVTVSTTTTVWWVRDGEIGHRMVDPTRMGLELHPTEDLRGGDAVHNAAVVREVFAGARGAVRDAVLLNAGIALAITQPDSGEDQASFDRDLRAGIDRAALAIDSGAATRVIDRWVEASRA
ncbi:anthranilate phosphoribosyltransferase [Intrasporangium calvum]|uniref:Anthranilate phosphoribosyltransferase n=1 Tax=Intrasporangium calvum (strain ATCC 23552 / DSM 43043 / JCM 3097 / NBRC 12989 / NCIMB 10167 / NRRL B-3866 / 7 KIP) TaxID=710696 RepID=E6SCB2_INTC7|nr:anthranilate phosphoribosyltransferase [Intrasporangium calvum]ADU48491.1 anthranilate phosphoribosyltransferase [Intrasporangium calvum DSM 43043]AXG13510.1 anthranilate phosphoribosyltransferase [Intrasporangium calvum]